MSVVDIENCRKIIKHMVVEANLVFKTPVAFASGDTDEMSDMPLLVDALESKPLLTGTTLAGALRSYLRSIENGDRSSTAGELEKKLFGGEKEDDQGSQSLLIVEDSIGEQGEISYRDGADLLRHARRHADGKALIGLVFHRCPLMLLSNTQYYAVAKACQGFPLRQAEQAGGASGTGPGSHSATYHQGIFSTSIDCS